ncbi:carboxypeptidase-like regulatory domain-containing protein [Catenovulum adriaticum]|uniref:Carboxypeptidase regulatory-like domain-containing protein n=1 Tax=Catenovulum adriaticum TaxID=2984846 RepID=A0ABY7ALY9_9ALTE|nr:carboxypeptidase-like regulatory domain-containing protein [Catenovulum sp. TS8]WAJ70161.1 carboxypeptidase regulatory-like domain-containing protein [Catenovulum sp. TS8]
MWCKKQISKCLVASSLILPLLFLSACSKNDDSKPKPPDNRPPIVNIQGNASYFEFEQIALTAVATDPDGDSITKYQWSVVKGDDITLSNTTTNAVSFTAPDVMAELDVTIKVMVTDFAGLSASNQFNFVIKPQPINLTLTGVVTDEPIANASVTAMIGEQSFNATTDNNGVYSLALSVAQQFTDQLVKLIATGHPDTHPNVKFVSQLPSFATLKAQAGDNEMLSAEDNFSLNVTNVTTAEAALLEIVKAGEPISDEAELNQLLTNLNVQTKLRLATLVKIVVDNQDYNLPDGVSDTLALLTDSAASQAFDDFIVSQNADLIEQTLNSILEDENLIKIGGENQDFDKDGVLDTLDAFPFDPTESVDTDMDGIGNNADTDDDGDTVADADDAFPLDKDESLDTDMDGVGNNADTDDDGDTVADADDAFPLDKDESLDTDMDGVGNNADTDDDGDTVADADDAFPLDKDESLDTDMDGVGNNADTDDDGDSILDDEDGFPLISIGDLIDTDMDGIPDDCNQACLDLGLQADDDDNGNGIPDDEELEVEVAVNITSPESLLTVGTSPITVTGTVAPANAIIKLNGVEVSNTAGSFSAQVSLDEGLNTIEARANVGDFIQSDTISVSLDKTPPYLTIDSHKDGATVYTDTITVTGLVNDIVRGTIEQNQANVSVNGNTANIQNRSYAATEISLDEGENTITVSGADQVGNTANLSIKLIYEKLLGKRVELSAGQNQSAIINEELDAPLQVVVLDDNDAPVEDATVVFRVNQGSGVVGSGTDTQGRAVAINSDENGLASTRFKLGARTGVNNHKVTAAVVGYVSQVQFSASANGQIGNKLSVNSGNNQRGGVGQVLPETFVVVVTDAGANVVPNARVKFEVKVGDGSFSNDETIIAKTTDSDGRASASFKLGKLTGIDAQRVLATLIDAPTGQTITAGFSATAFVPADPGSTTISGVVLDNQEKPIPGVTVRVEGSTREAKADESGQFKITEAPVGPVHLIADGSTAEVEGEFPSLSYNLVTVSGVDNPLSAPIYMVKLNTDNAVYAGPEDAVLELDAYPGFKLEIAKDSVTFPDGAREGFISVTPVNSGTVPMAPPNGMQPQFIVTIQPTGTKFDPPARLTLPNVDAHEPGAQVEMYSFDHDLEEFVAIGLGSVSEDGTLVVSNPGVGVIKAGWHCGSQPGGQSCAHNCPICQDCDGDCNCVPAGGDPRLASMNETGDCKKPECQDGSAVQVNDDSDAPADEEKGDCKSIQCVDGTPTEMADEGDETKCTTCGPDGPEPKPDGHVPDDDKCIICKDGKETKKPDNELGGTTVAFNGVKNFISDVNLVLDFLGADKKIPEVSLELSNSKKEVCCTQKNGAMTLEEKDAGSVVFPSWDYAWTPTIPPWSGDYTFKVFGKKIGVTYGIRFTVSFGGKFTISRTKRECQEDNCWGGDVTGEMGVGGGPFGSVPNPASYGTECGPDNDPRPCDLIRIQGTLKTGINIQAGVDCEKVSGKIGHNGVTLNAEVIVAEGSWVEIGASESWVLVNSADITLINIPLPN